MSRTLGPWRVTSGGQVTARFNDPDWHFGDISPLSLYRSLQVRRANAHLIAAAPEMLEALEIVFDVIEGAEGPTRTLSGKLIRWENIVETVQNAIAKANYEGRSQS